MSNIPMLVDPVYDAIREVPGIDTPLVCLKIYEDIDIVDPGFRGAELAHWLMEWYREMWEETCIAVDYLLEDSKISFSDDGELRVIGY